MKINKLLLNKGSRSTLLTLIVPQFFLIALLTPNAASFSIGAGDGDEAEVEISKEPTSESPPSLTSSTLTSSTPPEESTLSPNVDFQEWIRDQGENVVRKIMAKIASPNDTVQQHEAKVVVARYLVNVTLSAVVRTLKAGKGGGGIPETAALPIQNENQRAPAASQNVHIQNEVPEDNLNNILHINMVQRGGETLMELHSELEKVEAENQNANQGQAQAQGVGMLISAIPPSEVSVPSTSEVDTKEPVDMLILVAPASAPNEESTSASVPQLPLPATSPVVTTQKPAPMEMLILVGPSQALSESNNPIPASSPSNETTTPRPFLQEIFSRFNLTAPSFGGLNLTAPSFGRLNLTAPSFGGLNLTAPNLGGLNLSAPSFPRLNFTRFNLSVITGGGGSGNRGGIGGVLVNLTTSLMNATRLNIFNASRLGMGAGSLFNFNATRGNIFNFSFSSNGEGGLPLFNISNVGGGNGEGGGGALPFNLYPPPEGFLMIPTPPPMNDSVRMSQMFVGNQVEKLVGDINNQNLTGIVDSTLNIATPSTVGVLVNALLNIVLCNPLDRWNGNCGL